MTLIAFFYFLSEKRLLIDLEQSNMKNISASLSSDIIISHMRNKPFDAKSLKIKGYKIGLYNQENILVTGDINQELDFSESIKKYGKHYILIEHSTYGHLGIYSIAIEESFITERISQLKINIILFFIGVYLIISIIGFYLAKLFLRPIALQREKINEFIKDTTHELNTPITSLLMSTENDIITQKNAQRIKLSALRISEIYKDLSFLFLKDSTSIKSHTFNIQEIIEKQIELSKPISDRKNIEISSQLVPFNIQMNEEDFIRLFNNLLSNSIKYNKRKGHIKIELNQGVLCIKDSGIGIDFDKKEDIFKRYYRATTQEGGFGIGLNIVQFICKKYHLKIHFESKKDIGTSFFIDFNCIHATH